MQPTLDNRKIWQWVRAQEERRELVVSSIDAGCYLRMYAQGCLVWDLDLVMN